MREREHEREREREREHERERERASVSKNGRKTKQGSTEGAFCWWGSHHQKTMRQHWSFANELARARGPFFTCQIVLGLTTSIFTKIGGGVTRTASSSWMSALRKALVMSTLDHVVSGALAKLSINRKTGAYRLVVVVERSPHAAKLPQITGRLLRL